MVGGGSTAARNSIRSRSSSNWATSQSRNRSVRVSEWCGYGYRLVLRWSGTESNPNKPFFRCLNYNIRCPISMLYTYWIIICGLGPAWQGGCHQGTPFAESSPERVEGLHWCPDLNLEDKYRIGDTIFSEHTLTPRLYSISLRQRSATQTDASPPPTMRPRHWWQLSHILSSSSSRRQCKRKVRKVTRSRAITICTAAVVSRHSSLVPRVAPFFLWSCHCCDTQPLRLRPTTRHTTRKQTVLHQKQNGTTKNANESVTEYD
ncbi:hypothetical protein Ahy_A03g011085 [Arachis hypogaea]|uniref:Uncharacterized protein n=1 Tax=Arachis hypogaea TaxID=3818 RepID=A0A445DPK2_ARAHY|nr:hypothetical protein Ahy_A03g011085 [Arachis hypogaea]